jgi:predicted dehydrogenase
MNILIVGLGSIALKHIDAIQALGIDTEIYALRSKPGAEIISNVKNIYDLETCTIDFDFAIISNPTQYHASYIEQLGLRGINLFIEKPPVSELENTDALINLIREKELKTYVACNLRFHPCITFLKNYLTTSVLKQINEVNIYCGSYLPDWRPNKDFRTIYSANPEMGGGVHLDLFHELDYTHWLFGKPDEVKSIKRSVSTLNIPSVDYANYVLLYPNFTTNVILNYFRKDTKRTIEIIFDGETWMVDLLKNTITNNLGSVIFQDKNFTIKDTYHLQMKHFVKTIETNQKQLNTFVDSIDILKTCLNNE